VLVVLLGGETLGPAPFTAFFLYFPRFSLAAFALLLKMALLLDQRGDNASF